MKTGRDAELSALLDGALPEGGARALREEIDRDPALAARFAELARVDEALRALPARPVPLDLRTRLMAKVAADAALAAGAWAETRGRAPLLPPRRRAWVAGLCAAAAAAAAAVFMQIGRPASNLPAANDLARASEPRRAPSAARESFDPSARGGASSIAAEPAASLAPLEGKTGLDPAPAIAPSDPERRLAQQTSPGGPAGGAASSPVPEGALAADLGPRNAATALPLDSLKVEVTDEEAAALEALHAEDADVVAVLDWLDALDALEAEPS